MPLLISCLAWLVAVLASGLAGPSAHAAEAPRTLLDTEIKAAALYQFISFVEWPWPMFRADDSPFVIGLYRQDPFHGVLNELVAGETVQGHPIRVRVCRNARDAASCHMLFIPATERDSGLHLLPVLNHLPVLTVGDIDEFLQTGGIIQLTIREQRIRFAINHAIAARTGLKLSARLLGLAETVINSAPP